MSATEQSAVLAPEQRDTAARLRALGAATVCEAQQLRGVIDPGISAVDPGMKLAGPAFTVDAGWADNLMIHHAMLLAQPGEVLVIDARSCLTAGPWGDVLTEQALRIGLAGLVIDGAIRDAQTVVDLGFPVFSRGLCIRGTTKTHHGPVGAPVRVGGVEVATGDYVVGDRDGLVVIRAAELESTLLAAEARSAQEEQMRTQIRNGATTADLLGLRGLIEARHRANPGPRHLAGDAP